VDPASTTNPAYDWNKPNIAALPENLKGLIRRAFTPGHEVRDGLDTMPIPETTDAGPGGVFTLHTGDAWRCFHRLLLADPIAMIIRIGDGNVCPAGNNNPCPAR
jgi:hypothetical protein